MELQLHDRVKMKKPHPCGCAIFEVTRLGVDYKLKCTGCGREVLLPRIKAEKLIRGVVQDGVARSPFHYIIHIKGDAYV